MGREGKGRMCAQVEGSSENKNSREVEGFLSEEKLKSFR